MDVINSTELAIVASVEGLFEDAEQRRHLNVALYTASKFYEFLVEFEEPPMRKVDYIMGTIRAGIEEYFLLAYTCKVIDVSPETWRFRPHVFSGFDSFRERCVGEFRRLINPDTAGIDRLASLLELTHLELVFLARYYPSAIFSE